MTPSERRNWYRYEYVAHWLQAEAYRQQMEGRTKPLKQFHPCAKGLLFTAAMAKRPIPVTTIVIPEAAITPCNCHNSLPEQALWNKFFELGIENIEPPARTA